MAAISFTAHAAEGRKGRCSVLGGGLMSQGSNPSLPLWAEVFSFPASPGDAPEGFPLEALCLSLWQRRPGIRHEPLLKGGEVEACRHYKCGTVRVGEQLVPKASTDLWSKPQ